MNPCLLLAAWLGSAAAAPIPTREEPVIYLGACTTDENAPCWKKARSLNRFAAEPTAAVAPLMADIRLAVSGEALLVNAKGLPENHVIEVVVNENNKDSGAQAQMVRASNGIVRHRLAPAPKTGQIRYLRVLIRSVANGPARVWTPEGAGDLSRPAIAVVGEAPTRPTPVRVQKTKTGLKVHAKSASQITLTHRRPRLPQGGKGIDPPWSFNPEHAEAFSAPPFMGWYDLEATWRSLGGAVSQKQRRSFYWVPPSDERVELRGMHPAPTRWTDLGGTDLVVAPGMKVCAEEEDLSAAADWFAAELRRITGVTASRACTGSTPLDGGVWFRAIPIDGPLPDVAGPTEWIQPVSMGGFYVETSSRGAAVWVRSPRAGLYGAQTLVDLIGMDGRAPPMALGDDPVIPWRVLFHEIPPRHKGMVTTERYIQFLHRAVARGRINMLILDLKGAYRYESHPELSRKRAWSKAQLTEVLDAARALGIEVIPTVNSPGHADWITGPHPELTEEATTSLLCTRHPDTRPLLRDLYAEMIEVFGQPRFLHIGHDEIRWRTRWKHEVQRCPRCEGSPRWAILTDDLLWAHETLRDLGARPMLWSDMLVQGWHGNWDGMFRAANRLPEPIRKDLVVMSWGRNGDTVGKLVPAGFTVVRGSTGYADWKRKGLAPIAHGISGEALALFYGYPWSTFGGSSGPTNLYHHWPNVVLSGATAWRPDIADLPIDATLNQLTDHPAYLPGYRAWSPTSRYRDLRPQPGTEAEDAIDATLPSQATVHEVRFDTANPHQATNGAPIRIRVKRRIEGLSLLQATTLTTDAEAALLRAHRKADTLDGVPIARIDVEYNDGSITKVPVFMGLDTEGPDRPMRAHMLWNTAGSFRFPSNSAGALNRSAKDRVLFRLDWQNPRKRSTVRQVVIRALQPGAALFLAGIVAVEAP